MAAAPSEAGRDDDSRRCLRPPAGPAVRPRRPGRGRHHGVPRRRPLARQIGRVVQGQLPPLLPAIAGVIVTACWPRSACATCRGRCCSPRRWPCCWPRSAPIIRTTGGATGWSRRCCRRASMCTWPRWRSRSGCPPPATFALIAVIALHHMDLLYRHRTGCRPRPRWQRPASAGRGGCWSAGIGGMLGIETFFYIALAGYLWRAVRLGQPDLLAGRPGRRRSPVTRVVLAGYRPPSAVCTVDRTARKMEGHGNEFIPQELTS